MSEQGIEPVSGSLDQNAAGQHGMNVAQEDAAGGPDVDASLRRMGLIGTQQASFVALTGGVSSRILLVDNGSQRFCYKQALSKLNVADDWFAPVGRSRSEVDWIRKANRVLHGLAPKVLAVDDQAMAFAMEYFPIDQHPIWKAEMQRGSETAAPAAAAGRALAAVHGATTRQSDVASAFANHEQFHALRVEPFFVTVAYHHSDLAPQITDAVKLLESARLAVIHGDFSPKNILVGGKHGVIVLDAECATFGDPAFDYAFCLTHLLLKARAYPDHLSRTVAAVNAFKEAYRFGVTWESIGTLERRVLTILPILMLARVDGKSPVDYLHQSDRAMTRSFTRDRIGDPRVSSNLETFLSEWLGAVTS